MNDDPASRTEDTVAAPGGRCPKCGTRLEPYAEVDIGVGTLQGGPWGCPACHWVEPQEPSPLEERCGATMGAMSCSKPVEHDGPHLFEEDFL